jgi:hypothetical protein
MNLVHEIKVASYTCVNNLDVFQNDASFFFYCYLSNWKSSRSFLEASYMLTGFGNAVTIFPFLYRNHYSKDVMFRQHIYVSLYKGAFSDFGSGTRGGAEQVIVWLTLKV